MMDIYALKVEFIAQMYARSSQLFPHELNFLFTVLNILLQPRIYSSVYVFYSKRYTESQKPFFVVYLGGRTVLNFKFKMVVSGATLKVDYIIIYVNYVKL